jgi:hypothetical protein
MRTVEVHPHRECDDLTPVVQVGNLPEGWLLKEVE